MIQGAFFFLKSLQSTHILIQVMRLFHILATLLVGIATLDFVLATPHDTEQSDHQNRHHAQHTSPSDTQRHSHDRQEQKQHHQHQQQREQEHESFQPYRTSQSSSDGPTYESVSTRDANAFRDSIKHVVVLVLENRAFDHVLGFLYDEEGASDIHVRYPDGVDADEMRKRYPPYFGLNFPRYYEEDGSPNPPPNHVTHPARGTNLVTSPYYSNKDLHGKSWRAYMAPVVHGTDTYFYNQSTLPAVNPGEVHSQNALQFYGKHLNEANWWEEPTLSGFIESYVEVLKEHNAEGTPPEIIMESISSSLLPVIETLAKEYAVCDEWYSSIPTQTWANRLFIHGATSHDLVDNGDEHNSKVLELLTAIRLRLRQVKTIMQQLDELTVNQTTGWDWCIYSQLKYMDLSSALFQGLFAYAEQHGTYKEMFEFYNNAINGTLPAYSFVEPRYFTVNGSKHNDMHPCGVGSQMARDYIQAPVWEAQKLILDVYEALFVEAPLEKQAETLFVITFDEAGGGYDHMPPPLVSPPNDTDDPLMQCNRSSPSFCFQRLGGRVPTMLISPKIKPHTILRPKPGSAYDHASLISSIGQRWGPENKYPPLSDRDRYAPDFWHVGTTQVLETENRGEKIIGPLRKTLAQLDARFNRFVAKEKPNGVIEDAIAVADDAQQQVLLSLAREVHRLTKFIDVVAISIFILILTFLSWWYEFKFMPFSKYMFFTCLVMFIVGVVLYTSLLNPSIKIL